MLRSASKSILLTIDDKEEEEEKESEEIELYHTVMKPEDKDGKQRPFEETNQVTILQSALLEVF